MSKLIISVTILIFSINTYSQNFELSTVDNDINPRGVIVGDFDKDNIKDFITNTDNRLIFFEPSDIPNGIWEKRTLLSNQTYNSDMVPVDADKDGDLDAVVISNGTFSYLKNNSTTNNLSFQLVSFNFQVEPCVFHYFDSKDINNDGFFDIVTGAVNGKITLYLNNGNNVFDKTDIDNIGNGLSSIKLGDLNNDQLAEIIVSNSSGKGKALQYYVKQNSIWSVNKIESVTNSEIFAFDLYDFNNDGFVDVVSGDSKNKKLNLHINNGSAIPLFTPTLIETFPQGSFVVMIYSNLFTNDSKPDLVVVYDGSLNEKECTLFTNIGTVNNPSFEQKELFKTNAGDYLYPGDFDNDGDLDYIFPEYSIGVRYVSNNSLPSRIEDLENKSINIYPNPVSEILNIKSDEFINEILIVNTSGSVVSKSSINTKSHDIKIDVSSLIPNTYKLILNTKDKSYTKTFQII